MLQAKDREGEMNQEYKTFSIYATVRRASNWQSSGTNAAALYLSTNRSGSFLISSLLLRYSAFNPASQSCFTHPFSMSDSSSVLPINRLPVDQKICHTIVMIVGKRALNFHDYKYQCLMHTAYHMTLIEDSIDTP